MNGTVWNRRVYVMLRYCLALVFSGVLTGVWASDDATIDRVEMSPMDVTAMARGRLDLNNEQCALVKVNVLADDVVFQGNVVGDVPRYGGEHWVYMIDGTKELRFQSLKFRTVRVYFPDWGIPHLEGGVTYTVDVSLPAVASAPVSVSAGHSYLVLTVNPANAKVYVDGTERGVSDGQVSVFLKNGLHTYRVEAVGFLPQDGEVTIASKKVMRDIRLTSSLASLSLSCPTDGAQLYVNGEAKGMSTWNGELFPGEYLVEARKEGYRTAEKIVKLASQQQLAVSLPELTPVTGSLNINYLPAGATITLDGKPMGSTPDVFDNIMIGAHTVTISHPAYSSVTLPVAVAENQLATLEGKLPEKPKYPEDSELFAYKDSTTDKWGFKTEEGKIVIPAKYDNVERFGEGVANVTLDGRSFFIDKTGEQAIPGNFETPGWFVNGVCVVVNDKYKYGLIDRNGNLIIDYKYDGLTLLNEKDTYAIATLRRPDRKSGVVDFSGREIIPMGDDLICTPYNDRMFIYSRDNKYGYMGTNGRKVTQSISDRVVAFKEGIGMIFNKDEMYYIDTLGNQLFGRAFDDGTSFDNGIASVNKDGKWYIMNKKGEYIVTTDYQELSEPINGRIAFKDRFNKWGFINYYGEIICSPEYDDALPFFEGFAAVQKHDKWGYIDMAGKVVIPCEYDDVRSFHDGVASVQRGSKWGYIDRLGKVIIPFQYDYAGYFKNNRAYVKPYNEYDYIWINKKGEETK